MFKSFLIDFRIELKYSLWYRDVLRVKLIFTAKKWQVVFQDEATPIQIGICDLHDNILYYLIIIFSFVIIMVYKAFCINTISTFYSNHSSLLEFIWTIVPGILLLLISIPSFKLLFNLDQVINPLITLKINGSQWYWTYSLNDILDIEFTSYTKLIEDLSLGQMRLLEVDNRVKLPVLTPIRILVTANDVMHSWAVPSLGIKIDAIPGRINHGLIYLLKTGVYYGQCSELCGDGHYNMPIVIEGVNNLDYLNYIFSFSDISLYNYLNFISYCLI